MTNLFLNQMLTQEYDVLSRMGYLKKDIPKYIEDNLNPRFKLRPYQIEAIARFIHYLEENPNRKRPTQLLFNMATGSGKTLLMAADILYLYNKGYRNFLFFVNSTNIIEKTRDNFLNPLSPKYLFNERIKFEDKKVVIREVSNFDEANEEDINIIFTTIQGLYSQLTIFKENSITLEDFKDKKIVMISDEAHHINAWTRNKLNKTERELKNTWEHTVNKILSSNHENILLEYTATIDLDNPAIFEKYKDKIIFEYDLKHFRIDGYSKEVKSLPADLENWERMLQAIILSQYKRKIAEKYGIRLKPVILFKSKKIKHSNREKKKGEWWDSVKNKPFDKYDYPQEDWGSIENFELFREKINNLTGSEIEAIKSNATETILKKVFNYFEKEGITFDNLVTELKEDFSEEKCILLDSENIDKEKQIKLNTLEDENNEIRAIFAVKMLDEGWDVLNLFDIVRLYDTRDGQWTRDGKYKPGNTTIAEKQLIGRGARYYPFKFNKDDDPFKRKFDNQPENELKIIEELHYHCKYDPKYLQEITKALKESGIIPLEEKEIVLKVKSIIKETEFWKKGILFVNNREEVDRSKIESIDDIDIAKIYKYKLPTGFIEEKVIFEEDKTVNNYPKTTIKTFQLGNFEDTILRRAMAKLDFYRFNNLKKYFPSLTSSLEFIKSLKNITVDIISSKEKLNNLTQEDKLKVCLNVLMQLKNEILNEYIEYKGTEIFIPIEVKKIVRDKQLKINVGDDGTQEYGVPMSNPKHPDLQLNLANKEWYIYNENYGTYEEKSFVKFIDGIIENLKKVYSEVYLLRNASLFKIYNFKDGKAMEPDFVLFLKKENSDEIEQYQLFIESKGTHLLKKDPWKEEFLINIEKKHNINRLDFAFIEENEQYFLYGLPFYNENKKNEFAKVLKEKLGIE